MAVMLADWTVLVVAAYLGLGLLFGLVFVCLGTAAVNPAARGMPPAARALLLPGAVALWPWLLRRWLRQQPPPVA